MKPNYKIQAPRLLAALLLAAQACLPGSATAAQNVTIPYKDGQPWLKFLLADAGEQYSVGNAVPLFSNWTLGESQKDSLAYAGSYWAALLGANTYPGLSLSVGGVDGDRLAASSEIIPSGSYAGLTQLGAALLHGAPFGAVPATLTIGQDWQQSYSGPLTVLPQNFSRPHLTALTTQQLAHALGILSSAASQSSHNFGPTLSAWDANLFDSFGRAPAPDQTITLSPLPLLGEFILDAANEGYAYFQGPEVLRVLGGARFDPNGSVYGLPVLGFKDGRPDLSHIELKNGLLSSQNYRNYGVLLEAELAVLKDLGYDIDLQSQYGLSVYNSNLTGMVNYTGFSARTPDGSGWLPGVYNTSRGAVGLHVYGARNEVTQAADILSAGPGSAGIRIDGHGRRSSAPYEEIFGDNQVTVAPGVKVHAHGQESDGVLVAYGKDHVLISRGEIAALGAGGVGVRFDFGSNLLGNDTEYRGSWLRTDENGDNDPDLASEGLDGALVSRFDLTGTVAGQAAAIYIADNALVEEINLMQGAKLFGDIISDWDPHDPRVQIPAGDKQTTTLSFGWLADPLTGLADDFTTPGQYTPDAGFSLHYQGDILGRQGLEVQLAGGELTWQGRMDVLSYQQDAGTTLTGIIGDRPSVISADSITIAGGTFLGVRQENFQYGQLLTSPELGVLSFDAPVFSQDATLLESSGAFSLGAYDYTYNNVHWLDSQTLGVDLTSRNYNYQRGAGAAVTAPLALWAANPARETVRSRKVAAFSRAGDNAQAAASLSAWSQSGSFFNNTGPGPLAQLQKGQQDKQNGWSALTGGSLQKSQGTGNLWLAPTYSHTSQHGRAGYKVKGGGTSFGYDTWLAGNFFAGFALARDFPEYKSPDVEVDATSTTGTLYGGLLLPKNWELDGFLSYSRSKQDQKRLVYGQRYSGSYRAKTYSAGLELAKKLPLSHQRTFRPYAGYEYSHLKVSGYQENPGLYALNFGAASYDLHRLRLGADFAWDLGGEAWVSAGAYYLGTFGDRQGQTTAFFSLDSQARTFLSQGDKLDRHSVGLGLRTGLPLSDSLSLEAGYSFLAGKKARSHLVGLELNYKF